MVAVCTVRVVVVKATGTLLSLHTCCVFVRYVCIMRMCCMTADWLNGCVGASSSSSSAAAAAAAAVDRENVDGRQQSLLDEQQRSSPAYRLDTDSGQTGQRAHDQHAAGQRSSPAYRLDTDSGQTGQRAHDQHAAGQRSSPAYRLDSDSGQTGQRAHSDRVLSDDRGGQPSSESDRRSRPRLPAVLGGNVS